MRATRQRNERTREVPNGIRDQGIRRKFDVQGRTNVAGAGCAGATLGDFFFKKKSLAVRAKLKVEISIKIN